MNKEKLIEQVKEALYSKKDVVLTAKDKDVLSKLRHIAKEAYDHGGVVDGLERSTLLHIYRTIDNIEKNFLPVESMDLFQFSNLMVCLEFVGAMDEDYAEALSCKYKSLGD